MPSFVVNTNVPKASLPDNFITELSAIVAKTLGKPESYVCIQINPDQMMSFGGSKDPCAQCTLTCLGKLGVEENKKHSAVLMDKLNSDLKIAKDRMYILFVDPARSDMGYNGSTFA